MGLRRPKRLATAGRCLPGQESAGHNEPHKFRNLPIKAALKGGSLLWDKLSFVRRCAGPLSDAEDGLAQRLRSHVDILAGLIGPRSLGTPKADLPRGRHRRFKYRSRASRITSARSSRRSRRALRYGFLNARCRRQCLCRRDVD